MSKHPFIFEAGDWLGEGTITFNLMPEELKYYIRWKFADDMTSQQKIEIESGIETVQNRLCYYDKDTDRFKISLENDAVGKVEGVGVFDDKNIAWEFRKDPNVIEGYETYQLQDDGSYSMKAEYMSPDQVRTIIKGKIWKKNKEGKKNEKA